MRENEKRPRMCMKRIRQFYFAFIDVSCLSTIEYFLCTSKTYRDIRSASFFIFAFFSCSTSLLLLTRSLWDIDRDKITSRQIDFLPEKRIWNKWKRGKSDENDQSALLSAWLSVVEHRVRSSLCVDFVEKKELSFLPIVNRKRRRKWMKTMMISRLPRRTCLYACVRLIESNRSYHAINENTLIKSYSTMCLYFFFNRYKWKFVS